MFSHVTLGTNDMPRAVTFYDAVLGALGHRQEFKVGHAVVYGAIKAPKTFILSPFNEAEAVPGNGVHVAYLAKSRAEVDAFFAAAMAHGGTSEGDPGLRPHYHPNYYGAYVRDPDGNKLQAVCHSASG